MTYSIGDFFNEQQAPDVRAFGIIDSDEARGYRVAEKWQRPEHEGGDTWLAYWITAEALSDRVAAGHCERVREMSDDELAGMRKLVREDS